MPPLASRSVCQVVEIMTWRRSCKFADHGANLPRTDMGATLGDEDIDCRLVCLDGLYRGTHILPRAEILDRNDIAIFIVAARYVLGASCTR